jgi:hypothetical protein
MRNPPNGVSIMDAYLERIDSDKLTVLGQHGLIFDDQRLVFVGDSGTELLSKRSRTITLTGQLS